MEIRVLKYFLTVVREENISRAAELLHVTQPTLSRQISQLEEEIGTQLFIRGKHLLLTEAGILLRRRAEEVVELIEKIENEFEEQREVCGTVSIGSGGLISSWQLPGIMESFKQQYPNVQYELYTNNADYIKERLDRGLLDFGLLLEPIDVSKYDFIRMKKKEKWGVLMPAGCPLAAREFITKENIRELPLATTNRYPLQREIENWFGGVPGELHIYVTYNLINNVVMLVSSGLAYALTIEGAVNMLDPALLTFRPLEPELSMTSVLAWKKSQPMSRAAAEFLEYFKKYTSEACNDIK